MRVSTSRFRAAGCAAFVLGTWIAGPAEPAQAALTFEAESMPRATEGASAILQAEAAASGGYWVALRADDVGDAVDFITPEVPAGSYKVTLRFKADERRGEANLFVDGTQLGFGINQRSTAFFTEYTFGRVTFPTTLPHILRLEVLGRDSGSRSYTLSADSFTLEPSEPPPPTVVVEAEDAAPVGTGATASTAPDPNASGGVLQFLNADGVGDRLTLTTPQIAAGNYLVKLRYKTNRTRGRHRFTLSGLDFGTFDQYASRPGYVEITLPYLVMDVANSHTIHLDVTGKNRASSGYTLSIDRITFIGQ
jgi:hypothetical protein